jgi:fucose permease
MVTNAQARIAVAVLFAINGVLPAAWIGRLVDIQRDAELSDATLGVVMAAGALGGLAFGLLAGPFAARWGSGCTAVVSFLLMAPVTVLIAYESTAISLGLTLFWIFGMDAIMDAAMNAHSIRVQKAYGRSILNSFHGWWSLGTVVGSSIAAISGAIGLALGSSLVVLAAVLMVAALLAWRWLLPGPDPDSHLDTSSEKATDGGLNSATSPWTGAIARRAALLGLFIFLAVIVEDVPARWSSIYLTDAGAVGGWVSMGLVAFTVAMTLGRFAGDRLVDRFGNVRVVSVGMGASGVALGAALLHGGLWSYLLACLVVGFGVAPLFPAAIHAAAHVPGLRPATGIAVVSWLSRAGFLLAPIVVGLVAQARGIGWGVALAVLAAAFLVPLALVLREERAGARA